MSDVKEALIAVCRAMGNDDVLDKIPDADQEYCFDVLWEMTVNKPSFVDFLKHLRDK